MSKGLVGTVPGPVPLSGFADRALPSMASPSATIALLLAILASHRRTTIALYQLMRGIANHRQRVRPAKRERAEPSVPLRSLRHPATDAAPVVRPVPHPPSAVAAAPAAGVPQPPRAVPPIEVRCFGRFEVIRDGLPVQHWRRGKAKTLLKYLVVRHQPVPRDVLLDLLWPEADPQFAINGLRVALHALRQALGPCDGHGRDDRFCVIFEGGNYLVNPTARLSVDADDFTTHFESGRRLESQQQLAEAMRRYEMAEAIYRDDYLVEDIYEDWTLVPREEFKDQYLMILTKLADYCLQRTDAEGCIVRCHKILQKDSCREDAYRRLMRCYAHLGQRSQALHWYDLCVRTLRQELDVAPSEQTRRLYQQINSGTGITL